MTDFDHTALMIERAYDQASQSLDPSTKVGAVLAVYAGPLIFGHNDFASLEDPANATREERYEDVIHAEEVALLRAGRRAHGATLYTTHEPCGKCWRRIAFAGVKRVVFVKTDDDRRARWRCESGLLAALKAGVEYEVVEL